MHSVSFPGSSFPGSSLADPPMDKQHKHVPYLTYLVVITMYSDTYKPTMADLYLALTNTFQNMARYLLNITRT